TSDDLSLFHTIVSIKNDGHYFCGAGGNIPDGSDEALTNMLKKTLNVHQTSFSNIFNYLAIRF
ncbi:TPA: hypothetical protein F6T04_24165, partial [Escherichia coli]|uniref:hypothetical protein n=3 Tax=Escherichia coli TaxID=562 RepID=UPI000907A39B